MRKLLFVSIVVNLILLVVLWTAYQNYRQVDLQRKMLAGGWHETSPGNWEKDETKDLLGNGDEKDAPHDNPENRKLDEEIKQLTHK